VDDKLLIRGNFHSVTPFFLRTVKGNIRGLDKFIHIISFPLAVSRHPEADGDMYHPFGYIHTIALHFQAESFGKGSGALHVVAGQDNQELLTP